ncbi:chloride channel protein [Paracoccus sp. SCSIO 75233]|uniref:chloride channel protein n=1 Tax=Paracoccus sp. SCSIO 75233 TaxID=3017782 RepID=UPI0022F12C89|nr:chloride channel protein [Paracoccus sp. SCSIO 75233]WBU52472.1 chloride channel protein [Paracoccus sp. SCSIO 75233]
MAEAPPPRKPQSEPASIIWLTGGLPQLRRQAARALEIIRRKGPSKVQFWFLALLIGIGAGLAALGFRLGIDLLQRTVYGIDDQALKNEAHSLPWWWLIAVPTVGGLIVGLILDRFTNDGRARTVTDVIEDAALEGGRVEIREGLASAAASLVTLGMGGSSGREGPVVHMAGVVSTWFAQRISASPMTGRELLGCAVSGAVAASFNAPIAGALFAHEVILRHFSAHAFAPIAISAVAGTVINRQAFGGATEFNLWREPSLSFYVELPAFMLLGIICALVAAALVSAILRADAAGAALFSRTGWPRWLRPTLAGTLLGIIAIKFPHIIGVGYQTIFAALNGAYGLGQVMVFAVIKVLAVAITLGGRMGGGVFSPALVLGALTGLAFGMIATSAAPDLSGGTTIYAMAGMGAVGAAVLGAPISTALIIFEMTGDFQTGIAVMTAVSLSSALASRLLHRSFFLTQLELRGIHVAEGPQAWLPQNMRINTLMRTPGSEHFPAPDLVRYLAMSGRALVDGTTLDLALSEFDRLGGAFLPVIQPTELRSPEMIGPPAPPEIIGVLYHVDALRALNQALSETAAEEHA